MVLEAMSGNGVGSGDGVEGDDGDEWTTEQARRKFWEF